MEELLEAAVEISPKPQPGSQLRFVDEVHDIVDIALSRRHSKRFIERLTRLAQASRSIPALLPTASAFLAGGVSGADIEKGFKDLEGIFVVAGPRYTLITKAEIQDFVTFDSASAEGPKLRWASVIPS